MPTVTTVGVPAPAYAPGNIGYFNDMTPQKAAGLLMKCAKNYQRTKRGQFGPKIQSAHKRGSGKGKSSRGRSVTVSRGRK